ncbi:MAG: hypothetical protein QOD83_4402 [Solirubrobacteraceae bacterium]|nr:hypothetical protein [Solirubrobacteraceae bacterium]
MRVLGRSRSQKIEVAADATGLTSRAGTALLAGVRQRIRLTDLLCAALAPTRERTSLHAPGRVLAGLAVMVADGGRCVSDLVVLAGQGALFGRSLRSRPHDGQDRTVTGPATTPHARLGHDRMPAEPDPGAG